MTLNKKHLDLIPYLITMIIMMSEIAISFNSLLLPNIKLSLHINNQWAQATISTGLFALGLSGMVYGGISDCFGRKPIFIFSTVLFSLSSIICAFTHNSSIFMAARFIQGIGSGSAWIVGNACLKDIYHGKKYREIMNYVHAAAGITPAIAPVIGSIIAVNLGWRNCFLGLGIFGICSLIMICLLHQETLHSKKSLSLKNFIQNYLIVIRNPSYRTYLFLKASAVMLIFCEISTIPLVFMEHLNVPEQLYKWYIIPGFIAYISTTLLSAYNTQISIENYLKIGFIALAFSNILLLLLSMISSQPPWVIQIIKIFSYCGWGLIFGNGTAKIVSLIPEHPGICSALMIACEMLLSAIGISALSLLFDGTIIPLSIFIASISITCYATLILSKHTHP